MRGRRRVASLRAAVWALRAVREVRRELGSGRPVDEVEPRPPPRLPPQAVSGVERALRTIPPTCLERALVLQSWLRAHGERRDVVIGVARAGDAVRAHAWLDGDPGGAAFGELHRVPCR